MLITSAGHPGTWQHWCRKSKVQEEPTTHLIGENSTVALSWNTLLCSASVMHHGIVHHHVSAGLQVTHISSCVAGRPSTSDAVPKQHLDMTCNMNNHSWLLVCGHCMHHFGDPAVKFSTQAACCIEPADNAVSLAAFGPSEGKQPQLQAAQQQ